MTNDSIEKAISNPQLVDLREQLRDAHNPMGGFLFVG
ncbi:uncharacterized protein METZ01_LOCUS465290 [marine metagenome]|jgi:hypothetical protein|uniref:Uncharacterized protein n=1 Tax=marine metagenome TaxID=408172 RepID=A0A383AWV0_9ZZZZ